MQGVEVRLLWWGCSAAFLDNVTAFLDYVTAGTKEKGTKGRQDRNTTWIAFLFPDMHVPRWSCLREGQPPTYHRQGAAATKLSSFSLKGLLPSPELPSALGNEVRAPPPVAHLPVPTRLSKLQAVFIKKGKVSSAASLSQKTDGFFFSPYSFFQYLETRPLTADTVLIFLFSVIPSVAAVSSPLYFEAVRLMLKKPASVSYHELSQASF